MYHYKFEELEKNIEILEDDSKAIEFLDMLVELKIIVLVLEDIFMLFDLINILVGRSYYQKLFCNFC